MNDTTITPLDIRAALTDWGDWKRGGMGRTPEADLVEAVMESGLLAPVLADAIRLHYVDKRQQKAKYRTIGASVYYTTKNNAEQAIAHLISRLS